VLKFFAIDVFLLLVCFIVLQIMMKGTWLFFFSVMECNPSCSMKTLLELCESHFCKEIGKKSFTQ